MLQVPDWIINQGLSFNAKMGYSTLWQRVSGSLALLLVVLGLLGSGTNGFEVDKIIKVLQSTFECHANPSLGVAVVKEGKVLLSHGFGNIDLDSSRPTNTDTLFGIGSVTKSFTATLFVKLLYEKTNLTVHSKVKELLGDQFVMPDDTRTKETTFIDLLAHRTALPAFFTLRYDTNYTRKSILERLPMLTSPLVFRQDYIYSSMFYGLLGHMSELLGGDSWENLVTEHLFKPLGMTRSTFASVLDLEKEDNRATPVFEFDGPGVFQRVVPELSRRWSDLCGSGSILSTVTDMVKWTMFHLNDGRDAQGRRLLPTPALEELYQPRMLLRPLVGKVVEAPTFPFASLDLGYALGFRVGYYRDRKKVSHSGSTFGYKSLMTLLPEENVGVLTLMSGRDNGFIHRLPIHMYLMDMALGLEPWLNQTTMCTYPMPWLKPPLYRDFRPDHDPTPLRLSFTNYEGVFQNEAYGNLHIHYNHSLHSLVLTYGYATWQLRMWTDSQDTRERFYATGLQPVYPADLKPFYFVSHPDLADVVIGFNASGFCQTLPLVFCRPDYRNLCQEVIFDVQTYNVGRCKVKGCGEISTSGQESNNYFFIVISLIVLVVCFLNVLGLIKFGHAKEKEN